MCLIESFQSGSGEVIVLLGQGAKPTSYKVDEEDGEKPQVILLTDYEMVLDCTLAQCEHLEVMCFYKMKHVAIFFKSF